MSELLGVTQAALDSAGLIYRVLDCDPELADTAAFCEHYHFSLAQSANAIVVAGKAEPAKFACCIVLATTKLDVNKAVCKQLGVKRASFANADQTHYRCSRTYTILRQLPVRSSVHAFSVCSYSCRS